MTAALPNALSHFADYSRRLNDALTAAEPAERPGSAEQVALQLGRWRDVPGRSLRELLGPIKTDAVHPSAAAPGSASVW